MIDVSVIVVSWNTRELLAQCLASVRAEAETVSLEAIVVDNHSEDGSPAMVRERFPEVRLLENEDNLGFVGGNNRALPLAEGRYLLLLNSDATLVPGATAALVHFMDAHPEAGIVGPRISNPDGSLQSSYMDFPTLWREFQLLTKLHVVLGRPYAPSHGPDESREIHEADWVSGAGLMIRREAANQVGGLDPDYFMFSEEVDWCWRVRQAGWRNYYLPEAEVRHWGGQSTAHVSLQRRAMIYRSKWLFFYKHRGRVYAGVFRALLLAASWLKMALWALLSLFPAAARRSQARDQVRSYSVLLTRIREARA